MRCEIIVVEHGERRGVSRTRVVDRLPATKNVVPNSNNVVRDDPMKTGAGLEGEADATLSWSLIEYPVIYRVVPAGVVVDVGHHIISSNPGDAAEAGESALAVVLANVETNRRWAPPNPHRRLHEKQIAGIEVAVAVVVLQG